jgi:ketosteroid isomerase-like protein
MVTKTLALSMAMFLATAACFADTAKSTADETKAVEEANAKFYTGLNELFSGDIGVLEESWSHADDITCLGPTGDFLVGWDAVHKAWQEEAALNLGGNVEPYETRIVVGDDLAFSQCYEKGSNQDAEGRTVQVSIRATNVFRKENGEWKMISHHTDLLPFLQKETLTKSTD